MRVAIALALTLAVLGCQSQEARRAEHEKRAADYVENKQWSEAKIELLNLIQLAPEDAEARFELGETLFRLKEYGDGLWQYRQAVRLEPDNNKYRLRLARVEFAARQFDESVEDVEAILAREPENPDALTLRARHRARAQEYDAALADLDRALVADPDLDSALALKARVLSLQERYPEAERALEQLVKAKPTPTTWGLLALFLTDRERFDEAEQAYQEALASAEDDQKVRVRLAMANFYRRIDRPADIERILLEGREEAPDDSALTLNLARYYVSGGQREKAVDMLEQRAAADPDDPARLVALASFHRQGGDQERALEALDRALAVDAAYEDARILRAEILIARVDDPESMAEGRATVDQVLEANPGSLAGLFTRAKLHMADGEPEEASALLLRILEEQPDARTHYLLGTSYVAMNQLDLARNEFISALQLDASHVAARRSLAALYLKSGNRELAVQEARRGLGAAKADPRLSLILAEALIGLREPKEAKEALDAIPLETDEVATVVRLRAVNSYLELREIDKGRAIVLSVLAEEPANARALARLVVVEARAGSPMKAKEALDQAIDADPRNADLYRVRGGFFLGFNDPTTRAPLYPARAQGDLMTALELDPESDRTHLLLGKLRERMGNPADALEYYQKAIELNPRNSESRLLAGVLYERDGRRVEAVDNYDALLALPGYGGLSERQVAVAMNNLAWLLADADDATPSDLDRALELAQEARELEPGDPGIADTLGWVMYKREIYSAAIRHFKEAIEAYKSGTPDRGLARYHLALTYEATGRPERAVDELKRSLEESEAFPGRDDAQATLARLQ